MKHDDLLPIMNQAQQEPWTITKTVVVAWLWVACIWSVKRFVSEPVELGWGPVLYLIEMIYLTLLAGVFLVFASFRSSGMKGGTAILLCTLLGLILPMLELFNGAAFEWGLLLAYTAPGFLLGAVFAWLRKEHLGSRPDAT